MQNLAKDLNIKYPKYNNYIMPVVRNSKYYFNTIYLMLESYGIILKKNNTLYLIIYLAMKDIIEHNHEMQKYKSLFILDNKIEK